MGQVVLYAVPHQPNGECGVRHRPVALSLTASISSRENNVELLFRKHDSVKSGVVPCKENLFNDFAQAVDVPDLDTLCDYSLGPLRLHGPFDAQSHLLELQ